MNEARCVANSRETPGPRSGSFDGLALMARALSAVASAANRTFAIIHHASPNALHESSLEALHFRGPISRVQHGHHRSEAARRRAAPPPSDGRIGGLRPPR